MTKISEIIDADAHQAHNNSEDACTVVLESTNHILCADTEQAVWEDYIRHGKVDAFPSEVIIA